MWAAEPLGVRLSACSAARPLITFLMLHGHLRPGYDYLLERKISSLWRELEGSPIGTDLDRFRAAAAELGFSERVRTANASQVPARLLIQTGRRLDDLTIADLEQFAAACRAARAADRGRLAALPVRAQLHPPGPVPPRHPARPAGARPETGPLRGPARRYHPRDRCGHDGIPGLKMATCKPKTVSSLATRLMHFGRFLTGTDPGLAALAALDRRRHIEPYLAACRRRRTPRTTA